MSGAHEKKQLKGIAGRIVTFLESPYGLLLLFLLLVFDVLIVATGGILDIQYTVGKIEDCEAYVKNCMLHRRLVDLHASDVNTTQSHDARRLGSSTCDPDPHFGNHSLHDAEKILACVSIGILVVFFIEQLLDIAALGCNFFKNKMHVLDLVVIVVSLTLEVLAVNLPLAGLLIVARMWRFTRTGHGAMEINHSYAKVAPAAEGHVAKRLEGTWAKLSPERWKVLEDSTEPDTVKAEEISLICDLCKEDPEALVRCVAFMHARLAPPDPNDKFSKSDVLPPHLRETAKELPGDLKEAAIKPLQHLEKHLREAADPAPDAKAGQGAVDLE